ncbi:MAG: hypothetical protein WCE64_08025 [Bacteroidales bacterium]
MSVLSLRALYAILGGLLLITPGKRDSQLFAGDTHAYRDDSSAIIYHGEKNKSEGYRAAIGYDDGFIAAGSGGQIDRISSSGKITKSEKFPGVNFNCLLSDQRMLIAAGDNGTLMISSDSGIFRNIDSGTDRNINSLALFNGIIIAGTDRGEILSGDEKGGFRKILLPVKGNIVSVSARESDCYGVTDEGEIIHSADAINWDITDFNKVYSGFYKPCYFTRVLVTANRIAVAGMNNDGSPVLMFSSQGGVWTERSLNYTDDQGMPGFLDDRPNDIFYDYQGDEFFLACNNGRLMKLPSCSQCNKLAVLSDENLTGIAGNNNTMIIVGENFFIRILNIR